VEALTVATVPLVPAEPSIEPNDLALIALACQHSERLRFRYRNGSGQDSRRHVEPYRLVYTGRRWYLVAHDLDKASGAASGWTGWRTSGHRRPVAPGRPAGRGQVRQRGPSSGPYRWRARVLLDAPADVVAAMVPSTVAVVEAIGEGRCLLISGSDSLDMIALHLARLGVPFTPLEPAELRDRCAVLAERLSQAAHRYPAEEPAHD
jgi:Predicted transcriptional regulator